MSTNYPGALDTATQLPARADGDASATVHAQDHTRLAAAVVAIQAELGISPSAAYATLAARLAVASELDRAFMGGVTIRQTHPIEINSHAHSPSTAIMYISPVAVLAGDVIRHITAISVGASATQTRCWFAIYNHETGALIAQTPDRASTVWPANTALKLSLPSDYTVTADGLIDVVIYQAATTPATIVSAYPPAAATTAPWPAQMRAVAPFTAMSKGRRSATLAATATAPSSLPATALHVQRHWIGLTAT